MTTSIDTIRTVQHTHTPCYCEENVYNLISDISKHPAYVIFISNAERKVPIWRQRASTHPLGLVVWDYHVVLLSRPQIGDGEALIYDLDSTLPFPCNVQLYIENALPDILELGLPPTLLRLYRVVPASSYLQHFASDRSHMLVKEEEGAEEGGRSGQYNSPPPQYDAIVNRLGETNTLPHYLDMNILPRVADDESEDGGGGVARTGQQGNSKVKEGDGGGDIYGTVLSERQFTEFCMSRVYKEST